MFDRPVSAAPMGVRGGALAFGVHAAILAFGLHSARRPREISAPVVIPLPALTAPHSRTPVSSGGFSVPVPGPITGPLPPLPVLTPTLPPLGVTESIVPLPTGPGEPRAGDSLGVYFRGVVDQPPELLSAPLPRYPELLRQARVEGVVIVEGVVDTLGRMERGTLRVIASPHPALAGSAMTTVAAAIFRPGRVAGRAVRVLVQVPVRFTISGR